MTRTTTYLALLLSVTLLAACGSASSGDPDANLDDIDAGTGIDAPDSTEACAEFASPATTLSSYPATYNGDTGGAGADLEVAAGVCEDERSHYSNAGDDQVIALTNLTAGADYALKITSAADLAFYVATDCSDEAGGPTTGQCLLFVDEAGGVEAGDFTAPASGTVMLVVDQYGTTPAEDASYVLEVYEAECETEAECSDPTPLCYERRCVGCITPFDCTDPAKPVCDATNTCAEGYDACTGDDSAENGNDGPAGAIELTPTAGSPDVVNGAICSSPADEADWFYFNAAEGDDIGFVLDWTGSQDIDIIIYDSEGNGLVAGFYDHPETIRADDLAAGMYYAYIYQYEPTDTAAAVDYTLTALIPDCETSFDCDSPTNPVCNGAGVCGPGYSDCTGTDNGAEDGDDGPAGATSISVNVGSSANETGGICNTPGGERDYYSVNVTAGNNLTITLDWTGATTDLDLTTYNSDGDGLGFTWWMKPEVVTLTNLPAGVVYLEVSRFSESAVTANAEYTITVNRTGGGCSTVADCATEYQTQFYRGDCRPSGACEFIKSETGLAQGAACDSGDDCTSELCSYSLYESDADKSVCTVGCDPDADDCTTALGAGYACTTPFSTNFCHPACAVDTDCGVNAGSGETDTDLPWNYLTCPPATGVCDI